MRKTIALVIYIILIASFLSCTRNIIMNENDRSMKFSKITSDFVLSDKNNYGCSKIDITILKHILIKGTAVSQREVHDEYSLTGCSIDGAVYISGKKNTFTYDYGGIIYFSEGLILACGPDCCSDSYPYCSWENK